MAGLALAGYVYGFAIPKISQLSKPSAPPCQQQPINGQIIYDGREPGIGGHKIRIQNGSDGNAIIIVRDTDTGDAAVTFFVSNGETATVDGLRRGVYRVQWALGGVLGADCATFADTQYASEFTKPVELRVRPVGSFRITKPSQHHAD